MLAQACSLLCPLVMLNGQRGTFLLCHSASSKPSPGCVWALLPASLAWRAVCRFRLEGLSRPPDGWVRWPVLSVPVNFAAPRLPTAVPN